MQIDSDIIQGSTEWHQARLGSVGASQVADVIAKTKSGYSSSRNNLMARMICEKLTGKPTETYSNAAMQFGVENEAAARQMYQFITDYTVTEIGIVKHPTIVGTHASPDGLVNDDGLVEIKVPNSATHIETLLGSSIDGRYNTQMHWQMAVTGRKWCDFVSFDPRLPVELQIKIQRVNRNDEYISMLETEVNAFLAELDEKLKKLEELK